MPSPTPAAPNLDQKIPRWTRDVLILAGAYNLLWAAFAIFWPLAAFDLANMQRPLYPELWQFLGVGIGILGVGYLIAAFDPGRYWPVVLVGLLGKVVAPGLFALAASKGRFDWSLGWVVFANDIAWWIPFGLILHHVYQEFIREGHRERLEFDLALNQVITQDGDTLGELTENQCVLLVFLRHAGCTFCREALATLSRQRADIEAMGAKLAFVHMSSEERGKEFFARYGMEDVPRISDRDRVLYRAFDLGRGRLLQLFGFKVFWRGMVSNFMNGNRQGALDGDGFQMPGVFLMRDGKILTSFRHETAADRPDYLRLAKCDDCLPTAAAA